MQKNKSFDDTFASPFEATPSEQQPSKEGLSPTTILPHSANGKRTVSTRTVVLTALVAAIYTVLTLAIAPLSFGLVQVRFSEMLVLLAFFEKRYAPGLILGCFLANCFSPFGSMDVLFGTTCTAITMIGITKYSKTLFGASLWAVFCNSFLGIELYFFGYPLLFSMAMVALGEFLSVSCCGVAVFRRLQKQNRLIRLFKTV